MKHYIEHEQLSQLPGVTLRLGEEDVTEDLKIQVEIFEATKELICANWTLEEEDMVVDYKTRRNFDPATQTWYAEKDGHTVGIAECYWFDLPLEKRRVLHIGSNWLKEYYGTVLPDILLDLAESKCREMAAEMETDLTLVFSGWTMKKAEGRYEVYKKHGFNPVRYFFNMTRDNKKELGEYPLAEGIMIRNAEESEYRKVHEAMQEAFKDHWGYQESTEEEYQQWRNHRNSQPDLWKIAWGGDEVAGMVLNFVDEAENEEYKRKRGYTETICVRRKWRGKGIAKAIIAESLRMFTAMGMEECALGVDAENSSGALKLYQHLGFEEVKDQTSIVLGKSF